MKAINKSSSYLHLNFSLAFCLIMDRTFIIIPVYNEVKVLKKVLEHPALRQYQLIIVDDGSIDNPGYELFNFNFYLLRHSVNLGQGAALQSGMDYAQILGAKYVVHFDADGQHDPNEIEYLLQPLISGKTDVVLGTRFKEGRISQGSGMPGGRVWILGCAKFVQYFFTCLKLSDSQNGLRAFSAYAIELIRLRHNRMAHAIEIIHSLSRHNLKIIEMSVTISYTNYSLQKGQRNFNGFAIVLTLLIDRLLSLYNAFYILVCTNLLTLLIYAGFKHKCFLVAAAITTLLLVIFIILQRLRNKRTAFTEEVRTETIRKALYFKST